jgi:hypothetical protein
MPYSRQNPLSGLWTDGVFFTWQTPDVGGVDIQLANNGSRLTVAAQVPYDDLNVFIRDMIGFPEIVTVFPNGQPARAIARTRPYLWPDLLDNDAMPYLYCQSVARVEGVGPRGNYPLTGTPRYDIARVWLTFATVPYGIRYDSDPAMFPSVDLANDPDGAPFYDPPSMSHLAPDEATLNRYVATGGDPFDRAISIPTGLMRAVYATGDLVPIPGATPPARNPAVNEAGPFIGESLGRIEPGWDRVYTHHHVPEVPVRTILSAMGCVNALPFGGFPAGTLLCLAPKVRPFNSALGTLIFDIDYRFRYLAKTRRFDGAVVGHNHFLRRVIRGSLGPPATLEADVDYRLVTLTGLANGRPTYEPFDFRKLFRPDPAP